MASKQTLLSWFTTFQVASFLLYLSDVDEGGETMFPYEVNSEDVALT